MLGGPKERPRSYGGTVLVPYGTGTNRADTLIEGEYGTGTGTSTVLRTVFFIF